MTERKNFIEALGDGLEGAEGRLACALADQVNGLVDSAEGRHVDSLSANNTAGTDTRRVLAGAALADGVDHDLDGVLTSEEVDELHGLLDDLHSLLLFTVVPVAGSHDHAGHALNNGALGLLESALLVAAGGVGHEDLLAHGLDLEVVGQGVVRRLEALGWVHHAGCGIQWIHGRVNAELGNLTGQHRGGIQVGKCCCWGRIGQIISGHVNSLH